MKTLLAIILLTLAQSATAQSDSIPADEPAPDTVYVTKIFVEPGKVLSPKFIYRKGEKWYARGRRVNIILYKLRDGITDSWIIWPE